MYMRDWIAKLDDFLKLTGRDILTHSDNIGHDQAIEKARLEYEKYRAERMNDPSEVERHFIELEKGIKQLENKNKKTRKDV